MSPDDQLLVDLPGAGAAIHDLGLAATAEAIRAGEITAETYATHLLDRAAASTLNAFITIDPAAVLTAARAADEARAAGDPAPLLGVPIGVKDSCLTSGLTTTFGTSVLRGHVPTRDADAVAAARRAGAIVFGKTNLAEMSFGTTGFNGHHGQVRNPHDGDHITGGSSSGSGAAVAARLVPAAIGGDTVGSIRIPASLCGVVGFKSSSGRWPDGGAAPISGTLDALGVLARSVEDCALFDATVTGGAAPRTPAEHDLRGLTLAHAPRQFEDVIDPEVEELFRDSLRRFADAGAEIVEVDLGADFRAIAESATWPIFFRETQPAVTRFLESHGVPVTFDDIYGGLGDQLRARWSALVVAGAPRYVADDVLAAARSTARPELQRRYADVFSRVDALVMPTTPCAAPSIENQWSFMVAGEPADDIHLARNTHPGNCAGLPGISLPMGTTRAGLPVGIELDAAHGRDEHLLAVARRVERFLDTPAVPAGF